MLEHKGYVGHVEYDDEAEIFHGEIINTRDVITFQGQSVAELQTAFVDSIEDYLEYCAERGEKPEKPFSGKFMLRTNPDLHRELFLAAKKAGKSLNAWLNEQLERAAHI